MDIEFKAGSVVKHFKRELMTDEEKATNPNKYKYVILGRGLYCGKDGDREVVVYKALYDNEEMFVRDYDEFYRLVDKTKYPDVKQEYRFEAF